MHHPNPDHEWTQEELRAHLAPHGFTFGSGEVIPQGVKYISFEPLTESDIRRAQEIASKLGLLETAP